jgi:hypothetical protein
MLAEVVEAGAIVATHLLLALVVLVVVVQDRLMQPTLLLELQTLEAAEVVQGMTMFLLQEMAVLAVLALSSSNTHSPAQIARQFSTHLVLGLRRQV